MKGKIRVLLDDKTEYIPVVETLGARIIQLNREIMHDEECIGNIQGNLKEMLDSLGYHLKARGQMLETLKKLKAVKKIKDIDVEVHNPSEKINLNNPEMELCPNEEVWMQKEEYDKEMKRREQEAKKNS